MWIRFILVICALHFGGCGREEVADPVDTGGSDVTAADTIYSGGPILTMNDAQPTAEAVAVKDRRVIAVGALEDISAFVGVGTENFDLDGRTMVPGFVDSHGHVVMG